MVIKYFLIGFFAFNGIPHLTRGIAGKTHMTPFKRVSSPILNVVWGFSNLLCAVALYNMKFFYDMNFIAFVIGAISVSLIAAMLFGGKDPRLPWHKD